MNKFNIFKSIAFLSIAICCFSCVKDLDRLPTNDVTKKSVYDSPDNTMRALAKVYGAWALTEGDVAGMDDGSTGFVRNFWNLNELPTDEAICAWSDPGVPDLNNMTWSSSNMFVSGLYYRSIIQIMFANDFLRNISEANVPAEMKKQMGAEARFVRAFQYWVLMDCFGNPPFVTEQTPVGKEAPKQIQRAELFDYIVKELKEIETDLPAPRQNEYGRADKAAAWALLARIYLNAKVYAGTEHWADAATYADKVINAGYALMKNYQHLFFADNNKNNSETILSINFDGKKSQSYSGTTFLLQSSFNGDMKAILAGKNISLGVNGGWGGNRATSAFAKLFVGENDSRKLIIPQDAVISNPAEFKDGVLVYKYRNVTVDGKNGSDATFADIDFPLFRLAEMYLIYAEAALQGGGDKAKGLMYYNKVRERAYGNANANKSSITLQDILDERGRELFWEGFRRTDLIRFNKFTSGNYVWDWKGGVKQGRASQAFYSLYPIPSADITANSKNLKQNTGY